MRRWVNTENSLPSIAFGLILIALWELFGKLRGLPEYILPLPSSIARALYKNYPLLLHHGKGTLHAAILGLLLAIILALILAFLMNKSAMLKSIIYPLLVVSQTVPIIALAPVIMIWFGLGILPKILIVALVCFFPLVINVTEGLKNVDHDLVELLQVMGANSWDVFRNVQLPSVLPYFFSGFKISATYSIMGAVIGEWLGGSKGLGVYMIRTMHTFSTSNLFAAILAVVVLSLFFFKMVEFLGWLCMPYNRIKNMEE